MGEFLKVLTYQQASLLLQAHFSRSDTEILPLENCFNRVLAQDIISPENMPAFTRSTVDGYAVNCEDTFGSSETLPGMMEAVGTVLMGQSPDFALQSGQCAWIPTGGMLPSGSNAVVMVEYTEKLDEQTVLVSKPVGLYENVMLAGEDIAEGAQVFTAGKLMRPQDIGMLASLGIAELKVYKKIQAGILSTGDEVIPLREKPALGQIRDVNSCVISSAVEACGAVYRSYPLVRDDLPKLKAAIAKGLAENDLLLVSGGSSVGTADYTLEAMLAMPDAELLFHGIAMKPGKPTMAVRSGRKLIIGLPGHPVSALMVFHIVCAPLLRRFSAATFKKAILTSNVASQAGRDDFIPVRLPESGQDPEAQALLGKSGLMNILAKADGYIHIAYEKQGIKAGEEVLVTLF